MRVLRDLIFSLSYLTVISLLLSISLCRDQSIDHYHKDHKFLHVEERNELNELDERIKSTEQNRKYNFNIEDDYYS